MKHQIIKLITADSYTSEELSELLGINERNVRQIIAEDIHSVETPVIAYSKKRGYRIADLTNADDRIELYRIMQENTSRIKKLWNKTAIIKKALGYPMPELPLTFENINETQRT